MNTVIDIAIGATCLSLMISGFYLQTVIWQKSSEAAFWAPPALGAFVIFGYILLGISALILGHSIQDYWPILGGLLGVTIAFSVKNFFAAIVLAFDLQLSIARYYFFGEAQFLPVFGFVAELCLFWTPEWVKAVYTWGTFSILVGRTIFELKDAEFELPDWT